MEETVRGAIADALATAGEGTDVDAVLAQLGWLEMLDDRAGRRHRHRVRRARRHERDGDARSTTSSRRRSGGSRAPTSPSSCRRSPPGTRRDVSTGATSTRPGSRRLAPPRARELLVVCGTASEPWAVVVPTAVAEVRRGARDRSRRRPSRGPRAGQRGGRHAPRSRRVAIGRRPRPARGRAPDRRRLPSHAGPRAHATRWSACSSVVRSRGSRPCATGSRKRWSRWRRSRRRSRRPGRSRAPRRRRSRRPSPDARRARWPAHCQQVLAGIGFTTEHRVPPLPQADDGARGALRIGRRDRPRRRTAAARHAPRSDAHRAVTSRRTVTGYR